MRRTLLPLVAASALVFSGCYRAVIETGKAPAPETISTKWAHGFLFGLVAPKVTETQGKCPNGVSRVQTQHSFLNGLVAGITYGLYTPMQIDVTCAK
jgi:Bor protein